MGTIFSFVVSDVVSKIGILRHHMDSDVGTNYTTVRQMIDYEIASSLTRARTKPPSGSRTLLRLHRALKFLRRLFADLAAMSPDEKTSGVVWKAYDETLACYHTWFIRKAVGLAVYAVPSRQTLFLKMNCKSEEKVRQNIDYLVVEIQQIYDGIQELYIANDILDLP